MNHFINIALVFLLWNSVFSLLAPSLAMGQRMGMMMDREGMKEMMKRMMPDQLPPGIAPEDLPEANSTGAKLLQRYCDQCHDLPSPRMHSENEWPDVFQRMTFRIRMMSSGMMMGNMMRIKAPAPEEEKTLLAYLQRHGLQAIVPQQIPNLDSQRGKLFQQTCSQCHALPDPKQHTTQEWPGVVARMKRNMVLMQKPVINQKEEVEIVQFLQQSVGQ